MDGGFLIYVLGFLGNLQIQVSCRGFKKLLGKDLQEKEFFFLQVFIYWWMVQKLLILNYKDVKFYVEVDNR